ncbi:translation initiation factor IF-2 [Staphylococcus epidermidis]|jgi:translation initiation factor IF-2|uniref:Translation initiation factor IF-2 n=19 Tax=Staphylococcus epidermidis TaxID=1282 RepID=A0A2T4LLW1_STAEP|nr:MULTISPECIES: translation initiation factor IF-2 [Staphylococcus]EJD88480.1 translation initiation factor IF-2 [Staphylococcus epidermidis NIHLM070]EON83136.1 translation initiation factor IF-2 [Staphylococcus epidermidis 41tr]EON84174.1 translation initiation factor IF-2 [Staphylococcus epidermidis 528m]AJP24537.1 translation initiation factor IF-2 [Staphylococcus epidermidis]AUJ73622.1 translation initiation factor IF-2 [Staphylococcus epidermidis]
MSKKRIYEYAKELNLKSKEIIDELKSMNVEVSNHMQALEEEQIKALDKKFKASQAKDTNKQNTQNNHQKSNNKQNSNDKEKQQSKNNSKPTKKKEQNNKGKQQNKNNKTNKNQKNNKNKKNNKNNKPQNEVAETKEMPSKITYQEGITVGELAEKLNVESAGIIKKLFLLGIMANINQSLDEETLELIADDYGVEIEKEVVVDEEDLSIYFDDETDDSDAIERPAVVTIMGHVDHGKTTLLDSIRNTKVTEGEAGGITQHIGAYQIENSGKKITFLDTPGHAAFTTMRARGAQVTDITILVVAADDGVMPQTIEAINHAKEAEVPTIVAVNKIDKPTANPDRVMQELTEYGLIPEDWGGDTIFVPLSALSGDGIDDLLEMIGLVAEVQELKANPNKQAVGTVIEAELDKSRGPAASLLVQNGTLNVGDAIVVGNTYGRIRAMVNDLGKRIKSAGPSTPVEITGINDVPLAGDRFVVFGDEKQARRIGEARHEASVIQQRQESKNVSLDNLFEQMKQGEMKDLNVIIKGDVQGSVEALAASLMKIDVEGVNVRIIHTAVGAINESDVTLANASNGIIIGFNVRPDAGAKRAAEAENVDMRLHRVIYNVIEEIESAMKGLLDPEFEEQVIGQAEVRQTFKVSKVGTIAGSYVTEGKITRNAGVRVIRDGIVLFEGELDTLKRFKDDAKEVAQGYECGITIEKYNDLKEGDIIEAFEMVEIQR